MADEILTPVDLGELDPDDLQILQDDRAALEELLNTILAGRFGFMLVRAWCDRKGYLLLDKNYTGYIRGAGNDKG